MAKNQGEKSEAANSDRRAEQGGEKGKKFFGGGESSEGAQRVAAERASLKRAKEDGDYDRAIEKDLRGDITREEALKDLSNEAAQLQNDPSSRAKIGKNTLLAINRAWRKLKRERERKINFSELAEEELGILKQAKRAELYVAVTGKKFNPKNEKMYAAFQQFDAQMDLLIRDYIENEPDEQLAVAAQLKTEFNFKGDQRLLRKILVAHSKDMGDIAQVEDLADEEEMAVVKENLEKGEDTGKAVAAAVAKSPEMQRKFDAYFSSWKTKNVDDVFKKPRQPAGIKVETPSPRQVHAAIASYSSKDVRIIIPEHENYGMVVVGGYVHEAGVYNVDDGSTKLIVFDENADNGMRGPLDPEHIDEAFFEMTLDDYFSDKFAEFSGTDTQRDPTKVGDEDLIKIARAVLSPHEQKQGTELDAATKLVLENLAHIFVDKEATMPEKTLFFRQLLRNPEATLAAQKLLHTNQWSSEKSWHGFAEALSEFMPQERDDEN